MAKKKVPEGSSTALDTTLLTADDSAVIPRIQLGATGFTGLKTTNGYVIEEPTRVFRYPEMLQVVAEMRANPTVATALSAYKLLMKRACWDVVPPVGASPEQIEKAKFVKTCMDDMDDSWSATVSSWFDYLEYGSHVSEKIFRRRLRKNGSKFDDGQVGIKRLSPRSRSSIQRWDYSDESRELLGVEQTLRYMDKSYMFAGQLDDKGFIYIPRSKFLLFVADPALGNPEGNSILKAVYLAYKQLSLVQDQELLQIAKSIQGILKITALPRYFDPNASSGDKATLAAFQNIINNYNAGTQRGLLVPAMNDDGGKPVFTYDLMQQTGVQIDLSATIKRLQGDILTALSCDILKMGTDDAGSFSVQDGATNILTLAVTHRLQEMADVLNADLIPQLFSLNGWIDTELPKIVPGDVSKVSMDEFGKLVQRVASVGLLPVTRSVVNHILEVGGFETEPDDAPIKPEEMAGFQSNAGEGMKTPGDGTSKDQFNGKDSSAQNSNNAS